MNVEDARFLEEGVNGCYNQGVNGKRGGRNHVMYV